MVRLNHGEELAREAAFVGFNSSMVRLNQNIAEIIIAKQRSFNSSMVRLNRPDSWY